MTESNQTTETQDATASDLKALLAGRYVIAGIYHKSNGDGSMNYQHVANIFEAENEDEAIGKAVKRWANDFPEHSLFLRPLVINLQESS